MQGDIPASQMLNSLPGIDPARRDRLIDVLDIDPEWRMHLVSDGQRRRVQIAMGLLKPFQVRCCAHTAQPACRVRVESKTAAVRPRNLSPNHPTSGAILPPAPRAVPAQAPAHLPHPNCG